ncbi:unnamed protein product [Pylaiella littoralis]
MLEDKLDGKFDVILKILSHLDPIPFVTIKEMVEVSKNGSELAQWLLEKRYTGATKLTKGKGLAQYLSPSIRETINGDRMLLRQGGVKARKGELAGDGMVSHTLKTGEVSRPLLPGDAYVKAALTATCHTCDKTDTKYVGVHGTVLHSGGAQKYEMNLFKNRITKDMLPSETKPLRHVTRVHRDWPGGAFQSDTARKMSGGIDLRFLLYQQRGQSIAEDTGERSARFAAQRTSGEGNSRPGAVFEVCLSIPSKGDCFLLLKKTEKRPDLAHYFRDALSAERAEGSKKNDETPDDPDADAESYMDAQDAHFAVERMLQKSIALQVENKVQRSFADFVKENECPDWLVRRIHSFSNADDFLEAVSVIK